MATGNTNFILTPKASAYSPTRRFKPRWDDQAGERVTPGDSSGSPVPAPAATCSSFRLHWQWILPSASNSGIARALSMFSAQNSERGGLTGDTITLNDRWQSENSARPTGNGAILDTSNGHSKERADERLILKFRRTGTARSVRLCHSEFRAGRDAGICRAEAVCNHRMSVRTYSA